MKNKNFLKKLTAGILGFVMTLGVGAAGYSASANETKAFSSPYSMTIDSSSSGSNNVHWTATTQTSLTYDGITWSTLVNGTSTVQSSKSYAQIGTKNAPATKVQLSTTGFGGKKITGVAVTCYCMSNTGPTLTVTAGSTTFINAAALTKTTETRMPSTSGVSATLGSSDAVTITFNSSAKAAIAISKVEVSWETAVSNYNVSFNANGGSDGSMSNATTTGATYTTPANGFTPKTGYTFKQWALNSASGTRYNANTTIPNITSNISLYAIWNIGVTFDYKGHGTNTTSAIEAGTKVAKPSDPSVTGYTFGGWFTDSSCTEGNEFNFNNNVSAPTTVYAKWTLNSYNVVDSVANGTLDVTKVNHGTQLKVTINPNDGFYIPDLKSDIQVKRGTADLDFTYDSGLITVNGSLVTGDIEIIASCYKNYSVTINCSNGTANPTSTNIKTGETATIEFAADSGYLLPPTKDDGISVSGADIDSYYNGTLIIKNPSDTVTVSCTCIKMAKKSITVNMDDHVKNVTGYGPDAIEIGGGATVHMEAADGYRLPSEDLISVSGAQATFSWVGNKSVDISLSNCTGDVIISGSPVVRRTISTIISNGSANPASGEVDTDESWSTTLSPDTGYKLPKTISVTIGGASATEGAYTYDSSDGSVEIPNATGDVVISAAMDPLTVATITVTRSGSYGDMFSYAGDISLTEGGTAEITLTPSTGYFITDEDITVLGASKSYVRTTGKLTLSNLVGNAVSVEVSPQKREVTSINITSNPTTTSYYLGESLDTEGLKVMGTYNDGSGTAEVTNGCEVSVDGEAMFTTGNHNATVSYGNCESKTFAFNVQAKQYTQPGPITHTYTYEKVTSAPTDWRGKYLIVYDDSLAFDGSLETLDAPSNTQSITVKTRTEGQTKYIETDKDGKISNKDYSFTVAYKTGSTSIYSLKSASGKYISGTTTSAKAANGLKQAESDSDYEISFDGTTIQSKSSDQQMVLKFNKDSGQTRFRFYKSGQQAISLYKFTDTQTQGDPVPSDEKHVIRIKSAACTKTEFFAGDPLTVDDFKISVQYDTANTIFDNLKPTAVSESELIEGEHTYTLTFKDAYNNSKTYDIVLTAYQKPILSDIRFTYDTNWSSSFVRGSEFNHNGVHVWAQYSNGYEDKEVTSDDLFTPPNMNEVNDNAEVAVSYTEGEITKSKSYYVSITKKHTTTLTYTLKDSDGNEVSFIDNYYNIVPNETYNVVYDYHDGDYRDVEVLSGATQYTTLTNDGVLTSNATENDVTTFTVKCDNAPTVEIPVKVIASKNIILKTLTTSNKGAEASVLSNKAGSFSGYIGNTASITIETLNYSNPNIDDSNLPSGVTLEGSFTNGIYSGTITASAVVSGTYSLYVLEGESSDSNEISLTFSIGQDTIKAIEVSGYKDTYEVGQTFDPTMTVTATYVSGETRELETSEYAYNAPSELTIGEHEVTVYLVNSISIKDTFDITVTRPSGLNIVTKGSDVVPDPEHPIPGTTPIVVESSSWTGLGKNSRVAKNSTLKNDAKFANYASSITVSFEGKALSSNKGSFFNFKLEATSNGSVVEKYTVYYAEMSEDGTGYYKTTDEYETISLTITGISESDKIDGYIFTACDKHDGATGSANGNLDKQNESASYKSFVPGSKTVDVYNNNKMSDEIYDFIAKYGGENLCAKNWKTIFESEEYNAVVNKGEKALFTNGVASGKDDSGTKTSSPIFVDFINKYDELVATQGLSNYLERPLLDTCTITIKYNNGDPDKIVKVLPGENNYKLPDAPTYGDNVFTGWSVGDSVKKAGDIITVNGDIIISANWADEATLINSVEFKFTGLKMERFQYVFEGTCPDGAKCGFLVSTKGDADLLNSLTEKQILDGEYENISEVKKDRLVIGTGDGSKTVSVMFYYIDEATGRVVKSSVITMSFDSFVTADGFDPSIYEDKYAIVCLQYYIAGLQNK